MAKKIDFTDGHLAQVGELFLSDLFSDVTLVVEGQSLSAHRVILAAKSDYFRTLLTSGMKESYSKEVELKDTPIQAFRLLLRFIYTGQMSLEEQELEVVLDVLGLAQRYCFLELEKSVAEHLCSTLDEERVCEIFESAKLHEIQPLIESCYTFIDHHGEDVLEQPSFLKLPRHLVADIFSRDTLGAPEIKIFKTAQKWLELNTNGNEEEKVKKESSTNVANEVASKVRLELIPTDDLLSVVRPSGLYSPDVILDAMECNRKGIIKHPRGECLETENVISHSHKAKVICGSNWRNLFNNNNSYASHNVVDKEFLSSSLAVNGGSPGDGQISQPGIVIKLGKPFTINYIKMKLWDGDKFQSYSYVIDVSLDGECWIRVIDYSKYICRSSQNIYFPKRVVRFIRVIGISNNIHVRDDFRVVSLQALYTTKAASVDEAGILVPSRNVAAITGFIRKGRSEQGGPLREFYGYCYHDTVTEPDGIVVQLAQPHILDSIGLELDVRPSYVVEVSTDDENWERILDHPTSGEDVIGPTRWHKITFSSRPVVFIKIRGTGTIEEYDGDYFYLESFECPMIREASSVENSD